MRRKKRPFALETERLMITEFDEDMAEDVYVNSLDGDNRQFVPDEVFETVEEARKTLAHLIKCYDCGDAPLVYPVLLRSGENIGYVQAVPHGGRWEVGYHIAHRYTGCGYATEAVSAFLPVIMRQLGIDEIAGICLEENKASCSVLEKNGFTLEYKGLGDYQGNERMIRRYTLRK